MTNKHTKLPFWKIEELVNKKLDTLEAGRLCDKMKMQRNQKLSYNDMFEAFNAMFSEDLN